MLKGKIYSDAVTEYRAAKKAEKEAKERAEAAKAILIAGMAGKEKEEVEVGKSTFDLTYKVVSSTYVSVEKVKAAFPDTWAEDFGEIRSAPRFTVK